MKMKRIVLLLVVVSSFLFCYSQESQTAYNFLRLPVSAHAAALGGDNISIIEDDASLIFSNPALLSSVSDKTIALNYMNYMEGAIQQVPRSAVRLARRLRGQSADSFLTMEK